MHNYSNVRRCRSTRIQANTTILVGAPIVNACINDHTAAQVLGLDVGAEPELSDHIFLEADRLYA